MQALLKKIEESFPQNFPKQAHGTSGGSQEGSKSLSAGCQELLKRLLGLSQEALCRLSQTVKATTGQPGHHPQQRQTNGFQ